MSTLGSEKQVKIDGLSEDVDLRLLELDLSKREDLDIAGAIAGDIAYGTRIEQHLVTREPSQVYARLQKAYTLLVVDGDKEGRPELVSTCSALPMLGERMFGEMKRLAYDLAETRDYQAGKRLNEMTSRMSLTRAALEVGGIGLPHKDLKNTEAFVNGVAELATGYTSDSYRGKGLMSYLFQELVQRTEDKPVVFGVFDPENAAIVKPFLRADLTIFGPERLNDIPFAATFFNLCPYDDNSVGIKNGEGDLPAFLKDHIKIDEDLKTKYSFEKLKAIGGNEKKILAFNAALQEDFGSVENLLQVLLMLRNRFYSPIEAKTVRRVDGGTGIVPVLTNGSITQQIGISLSTNAFATGI